MKRLLMTMTLGTIASCSMVKNTNRDIASDGSDHVRWGRSQIGGNLVENRDFRSQRHSSIMDCKNQDRRGGFGYNNDTQRLTKSFCIYMSNKDKLENIWIDLDVSKEQIAVTEQYIYAEKSKKDQYQRQLNKIAQDISKLELILPTKVKHKIAKETKFAGMDNVIKGTQFKIDAEKAKLPVAQKKRNAANSAKTNYYNSTYSKPEKVYNSAVTTKDAKSAQLKQTIFSISLKKKSLASTNSQLSIAKGSLPSKKSAYKYSIERLKQKIQRKSYRNTTGYKLVETTAQKMYEEYKAGRGNNTRTYEYHRDVFRKDRKMDIDKKYVKRFEEAMRNLIAVERQLVALPKQITSTQNIITSLNAKKETQTKELKSYQSAVSQAYAKFSPLKTEYDSLVSAYNTAQGRVNTINSAISKLEIQKKQEIKTKKQLAVDVEVIAGEIQAKQNLIVQKKLSKKTVKKDLDSVAGHVQELKAKIGKLESKIYSLKDEERGTVKTLKQNAVVETYDRNLGVAATHIFVGAFPYSLGTNELSYNRGDDYYSGRNRFGRRDFRNARHGQNIKGIYDRAVRNGERIFIWGNFNNSEIIDELSSETGVYAAYYPRRTRRNFVEVRVETKSSPAFTLRSEAEHRLTFLDYDPSVAVPVIFASTIRRGYVGKKEVVMSATTKPSGAVVFTSGLCITDFSTRNLEIILDKVNRANIQDFSIATPTNTSPIIDSNPTPVVDTFTGEKTLTIRSGKKINDKVATEMSVEDIIQMDIPAGKTISEAELRVKMSHTYVGDVSITLVTPSGTQIPLRSRRGGSSQQIDASYKISALTAELEVRNNLDTRAAASSLRLNTGSLAHESAAGSWKVIVKDEGAGHGDQGTVEELTLRVKTN